MSQIKKNLKKSVKLAIKTIVSPKVAKEDMKVAYKSKKTYYLRQKIYKKWFKNQKPTPEILDQQRKDSKQFTHKPLVSVILPIYNTNEQHLRECIESVIAQTYSNWELCVADDASPNDVLKIIKEYARKYRKKIKFTRLDENQHIAGSSNEAIKLANGEFIALLDHDDLLMPDALFEVVKVINQNPSVDFVYTDEDKIEDKKGHTDPAFKPDWSPDFLRSCNYITHFAVLRKKIVDEIGGFRYGTEGAQDWDLFLRFTQKTQNVHHIAKILYSWRKSETSTAKTADSKPYAYINQLRVIRDDIKSENKPASVLPTEYLGFWNVKYEPQGNPLVSIIIPTKDNYKFIRGCLESIIEKTTYPFFEIIVVDTGTTSKKVLDLYGSKLFKANQIKIVKYNKKFNFSSACNLGAKESSGEYLLFLNDDTEVITPQWIENMLGIAEQKGVGMVGCNLMFANKHTQHAGVVLSERDIAFHPFYTHNPKHDIYTNVYISNIRNCAAVTAACSIVSRTKFNKVGGFDEKLRVTYNDVDLCLRLLKAGHRNVYTPYSKLYHFESQSVGRINTSERDHTEIEEAKALMRERWGELLKRDPYYNENFLPYGAGYRLTE